MNRHPEIFRPAWVEINLAAIYHNIQEVRRLVGPAVEIMAVVKAEAYGHGAVRVAETAIAAGASYLGVALSEEAILLRKAGLQTPILIFSPLLANQVTPVVQYDLTATVCNWEAAVALSQEAMRIGKTAQVHVKVDTGMGRVGIHPAAVMDFMRKLTNLSGLMVTGIFSHLATADEKDKHFARQQIQIFTGLTSELKVAGLLPQKVHLANSAGIIELPTSHFNMVRPGIMLYGLYPSKEVDREKVNLEPALALKAKITFVKKVPAGTGISYGQKYHTKRESIIATIPLGYADGWSRILIHKAEAIVHGKRFPIVGTICMDQCMIDLGDEPVEIGQEVVLIGKAGTAEITVDSIADKLGTINYEVTCMLSDRLPRIYLES